MRTDAGRWSLEFECPDLEVHVDRIKLRQAIRNLVANAIEAQPEGGRVRVSVEARQDEFLVHVHDAGPGVPADLARRVAEPFFTTRAEGTGLGLALVHSIVRLHGGALELSPSPSLCGGAHFVLRLPRIAEKRTAFAA